MRLFIILLQISFIVLKLTNVVHWNWFFVFAPFIFSGGVFILTFIFVLTKNTPKYLNDKRENYQKNKFQRRMQEKLYEAQEKANRRF